MHNKRKEKSTGRGRTVSRAFGIELRERRMRMEGMSFLSMASMGSLLGFLMFLRQMIPREAWEALSNAQKKIFKWLNNYCDINVPEFSGTDTNMVYDLVEIHVASLTAAQKFAASKVRMIQVKSEAKPRYNLDEGEWIDDVFEGAWFRWRHEVKQPSSGSPGYIYDRTGGIKRSYILTVHKRYKDTLLPRYLEHVSSTASKLRHTNQGRKLYINTKSDSGWEGRRPWQSVTFKHPSTFNSIALEPELKTRIMEDLDSFMEGEDFFNRVGRAWKRGYLLYGPPGTGKSSLVAAIANYTRYDVYDLELTEVRSNAELRKLLMSISDKSVIVIEDIDCSLDLKKRGDPAPPETENSDPRLPNAGKEKKEENRVTLSGLLNFIDGLWSCTGGERIIIFTTNHRENLDKALLRSGRMDMHILLSYCGYEAFKTLAWTHLRLRDHPEFSKVEELIGQVEITPADIAEVLIQNRSDSSVALQNLVEVLEERRRQPQEADAPPIPNGEADC